MKSFPSLGVVILGAGASSRMGRPKLLLPWANSTVVSHIIRLWRELGAGQIAIVHRPNDLLLAAELDRLNVPLSDRIENPHPEQGMFSSILCAAHWNGWKRDITSRVITLGDQPHLRLEMLRTLLTLHYEHPNAVCQPKYDGRERHPVVLPQKIFDGLKTTRAETLKDFLKLIPSPAVQYSVNDASLSLDLDTPEDYKEALTHFSAHEKS
jgi:molybdenum cofactor cytidylyltransferase